LHQNADDPSSTSTTASHGNQNADDQGSTSSTVSYLDQNADDPSYTSTTTSHGNQNADSTTSTASIMHQNADDQDNTAASLGNQNADDLSGAVEASEEAPLMDQNDDDWDANQYEEAIDPSQDQNADDLDPNADDQDMVEEEQWKDDDLGMWEAPAESVADPSGEGEVDENSTLPVQIEKDEDLDMWGVPEEERVGRTPVPEWLDQSSTSSPQSGQGATRSPQSGQSATNSPQIDLGSSRGPTTVKSNFSLPGVVSCQGLCGSKSLGSCWCDALCKDTSNCCPDYDQYCVQGKDIPPRQEDEEDDRDSETDKQATATCSTSCHTNSEEASPVKNACCVFPFFFDANGDGEAEEHNTCIEVAEGGWCSTHVDQNQQFQEGRWGYCQREGCEFRSPLFDPSQRPPTRLPVPPATLTPEVTGNETSTELNTATPIIITPLLPLLPLPDLLPPPGTPISIPCGMFDPIQAALPVHLRSC